MQNPQFNKYDDTVCAHCGAILPEIRENANLDIDDSQYFAFEGFCDALCAIEHLAQTKGAYTQEFMKRIAKRIVLDDHSLRNAAMNAYRQGRLRDLEKLHRQRQLIDQMVKTFEQVNYAAAREKGA